MAPYSFVNRLFMILSCAYGALLLLSLLDSGSYSLSDPVPTPPKAATVTEQKENEDKEKQKQKQKEEEEEAKAKLDFKGRNMLPEDKKKDTDSKLAAAKMGWAERTWKRTPHYLRWWNAEFVAYEIFVVAMVGCSLSGLWIIQWLMSKPWKKKDRD